MVTPWPLIGRVRERGQLERALRPASAPGPAARGAPSSSGVLMVGEAGVGKTRLAAVALDGARERGLAVRWVSATSSARPLPLGAFAPLTGVLGSGSADVLAQAAAAVTAGVAPSRLVLGVDDVHLLDELSALLLHHLAVTGAVTVVATARSGRALPGPVTALWKDGLLDRLELQPLRADETRTLLEAALGGQVESTTAERLWQLTGGNALYLRHLVDEETAAGRLRDTLGVWRWNGSPRLSNSLVELIGSRIGALPGPEQTVLDLLALAEPLSPDLLDTLAAADGPAARPADSTAAGTVEAVEQRGLVRVDRHAQGLQVRLAHPLYGEGRRLEMGVLRARRLRGAVVRRLPRPEPAPLGVRTSAAPTVGDPGDPQLLRYAVLALESDLPPDPALLSAAAQAAVHLLDLRLAERLARAAEQAGGAFTAQLTLAYSLIWQGRGQEAETVLAAATDRAADSGELAAVTIPRAANLFWALCDADRAHLVLHGTGAADALGAPGTSITADTGAVAGLDSAMALFLGRPHQAVASGLPVLTLPGPDHQAVLLAAWGVVGGSGVLGLPVARAAAESGYAAASRIYDGSLLEICLAGAHQLALRLAGELEQMQEVASRQARTRPGPPGLSRRMGLSLSGFALLARGRVRSAARELREARSALADADIGGWEYMTLIALTTAVALSGDADAAAAALADLESHRHGVSRYLEPERLLAHAWTAACGGALSRAAALAEEAARTAALLGQPAQEVAAWQQLARLGSPAHALRAAPRLAELAGTVHGRAAPAAAAYAAARAASDGPALDTAAAAFADYGDLLSAADAAAQAAAAHHRAARHGSATMSASRSSAWRHACEDARTPAGAEATPLPLTGREREIALLIGRGLSNRQIADQLTLSVRTVEGHIYRACTRLGVGNRSDLAEVIGDR